MATPSPALSVSAAATSSYATGNSLFKQGRYEEADSSYAGGISALEESEGEGEGGEGGSAEAEATLRAKLLLNRAQCRLLLRDYEGAAADCARVLSRDPANIKALFRRATALQNIGRFVEAGSIVDAILQLRIPNDLLKSALKMRGDIRGLSARDAEVQRTEGVPVSFITERQVVRLSLGSPHIERMACGRQYALKLCLGNEFGLFNKALLPERIENSDNRIRIRASVISTAAAADGPPQYAVQETGAAAFAAAAQVRRPCPALPCP
jgi:tetratricopeptide (TPR) repeat protein